MPALRVVLQTELDGKPLDLLIRRLESDELAPFVYELDGAGNATTFFTLPITTLDVVSALILQADLAVNIRFNAQIAGHLPMAAGSTIILLGTNLAVGAFTNITVNNPADAGNVATLRGLALGT